MSRVIDAELKYCPRCNDEYRTEIVACVACDIALISGIEMLEKERRKDQKRSERNMTLSPDDEMVSIRKGSVIQMKDFQTILKREGIPTLAVTEDDNCGQGCCGTNLVVQVRRSDAQEVMAILERDHVRSTGLEEYDLSTAGAVFNTAVEHATCPACGHNFPTTEASCPDCGLCFA
ncbi:MAG: hypothetical protein D3924_08425 [Candidatus Electrothrix sp. AR4]|nr:hypothetical protein [Candidatus Electrothrix sp. AR4]